MSVDNNPQGQDWNNEKYGGQERELSPEEFQQQRSAIFAAIENVVRRSKGGIHTIDKHVVGAVLFGSWIQGPATNLSDIDVILLTQGTVGDVRRYFKEQIAAEGITNEVEIFSIHTAKNRQNIEGVIREEQGLFEESGYQLFK